MGQQEPLLALSFMQAQNTRIPRILQALWQEGGLDTTYEETKKGGGDQWPQGQEESSFLQGIKKGVVERR